MRRLASLTLPTLVAAVVSTAVVAQRETAALDWNKQEVAVEYGPVPVGNHGLADLEIGTTWRMGMNEASQLRLSVPLFAGEHVVAPGSYRAQLRRRGEQELELVADGAGFALGGQGEVAVPGKLGTAPKGKGSKKLELAWGKPTTADGAGEVTLEVRFGEVVLSVPVRVVGTVAKKGKVWLADVFTWPAEVLEQRVEKGLSTPIATLRPKTKPAKGEPAGFNVVLGKDKVRLVPMMSAPTDSFGFGELVPPAASAVVEGKVEWQDAEKAAEPALAVVGYEDSKDQVVLEVAVGARRARCEFAMRQKREK
jgi:hypothetical protein